MPRLPRGNDGASNDQEAEWMGRADEVMLARTAGGAWAPEDARGPPL